MPQSSKYVVKVTNRSGFDKSHRNTLTLKCGTITPLLCDELIPGSRVNLKLNLACQLAPLVSDTYMNVKLKAEAFFVPSRLLVGSFEDFYCDSEDTTFIGVLSDGSTGHVMAVPDSIGGRPHARVPRLLISSSYSSLFGPGSLADYLGFTFTGSFPTTALGYINPMPFLAYHLVWQEWYRNPRVQKPAFVKWIPDGTTVNNRIPISGFPYYYFHEAFVDGQGNSIPANELYQINSMPGSNSTLHTLADGKRIFDLRQRNFGSDYFTNARVDSQQGSMSRVVAPDNVAGDAEFTIAALRLMNSLQQYKERNNIPSPRMVDVSKNRYGVTMSDSVAQRPICLGSASYDVYSRGVDQTAPGADAGVANDHPNPFGTVGTIYGKAYASGSDFIIDDFEAKEPGYLLVNITLVPEATYSAGLRRMFTRYTTPGSITDMANPLLQNVGDQPVYSWEATGQSADFATTTPPILGYQDRYSDWMYIPNQVHGMVRPGQSLQQFVLQRPLSVGTQLSSSFLEIPANFFDSVMVGTQDGDSPSTDLGFSAWVDSMLQYRVSMPLAEFSIPSLQNPAYEHGKTVVLRRNGQIF